MQILRIIHTMNPAAGGPMEGLRQTAAVHARSGHSTEIACVDSPEDKWVKERRESGSIIHALGPGRFGWGHSARLGSWLFENLGRFDAAIVHGLWLYPSCATWNVCRALRREQRECPPYFVMPHGMLDPWFQRLSERPLKAVRNSIYWKLIEHRVLRDSAGVLFTCEEERRRARQPFRPYRCREEVVAYGTAEPPKAASQMEAAFFETCPAVRSRPYLLFMSRLHPKKGADLLIEAYGKVARSYKRKSSDPLPDLVIAGPPQDAHYAAKLRQIAKRFDPCIASQIHFPGMLAGDAKWGAFHGCDVFILPSHQENFGIVVAEAMACGKPVLVSDQVNIWREIQTTGGGFVEPDSMKGIERLICRWQELSPDGRNAMSQRARACFDQHFALGAAAESLIRAIDAGSPSPGV